MAIVAKTCKIEACGRVHFGLGYCQMHHGRLIRNGHPLALKREPHGLRHLPEYRVWVAMKKRCNNPNDEFYVHYGGRGIAVCERWQKSFKAFIDDMGRRPSDSHSVERENNDLGYFPENCRWATMTEQNINRGLQRNNKSGHRGVYWSKQSKRWAALIAVDHRDYHLGYFADPLEAAYVRDQFALVLHGERAYLNVL